jgi:hypothetical protein
MAATGVSGRRVRIHSRWIRKTPKPSRLSALLESRGFLAAEHADEPLEPGATDILWIQGSANWSPRLVRSLRAMRPEDRPYVILWQTEPLPLPRAAGIRTPLPNMRELAKIILRDPRATDLRTNGRVLRELADDGILDVVIVSTKSRMLFLREFGIESHFVPWGYDRRKGEDLGLERDIPALFVGIMNDPRHRSAVRSLRRDGTELMAAGAWDRSRGLWGATRTQAINRASTFLALQRYPGKLSGLRMILGMANKSLVISEPIVYPEPYVPGEHYVSASLKDMPDVIRYYLDRESERARIAEAGHRFVTTELTLERSLSTALNLAGLE